MLVQLLLRIVIKEKTIEYLLTAQSPKWRESSNSVFPILIYEFNIYLVFQNRGRQLLERGAI